MRCFLCLESVGKDDHLDINDPHYHAARGFVHRACFEDNETTRKIEALQEENLELWGLIDQIYVRITDFEKDRKR